LNIYEYQGKELFGRYGIPVPDQRVVEDAEGARAAAQEFGKPVVVKAQVPAGGRGKAGGVKVARDPEDAVRRAEEIFGLTIKGYPVRRVLITPAAEIKKEYYLGITVDRAGKAFVLILSAAGGVDIEELAEERPEEIHTLSIYPQQELERSRLDKVLRQVFESESRVVQAREVAETLYRMFLEKDCSLVEVNPYAVVDEDRLVALDSKVSFDDNAVFRHEDVAEMRNPEEWSDDERDAKDAGLAFVSMEGDIGCIVNGAGLAMATMDIIKLYGGNPANFLDVGGSSSPDKVVNALRIIQRNPRVDSILVNIFGGITRCDDIANGILMALEQIDLKVPMVVRLIGTNEEEGRRLLTDAGFEVAEELSVAVNKVVDFSGSGRAGAGQQASTGPRVS